MILKEKISAPKLSIIKKLAIELDKNVNYLNDLAAISKNTIAPDINEIINDNPNIVSLIRSIKKNELSNKEINILEKSINKNNAKALIFGAGLGSRLKKHTKNLAPNYFVYLICKTIVIFFRAIPEFIIAMILVIAIGFGAMPGVLALVYTQWDF